MILISIFKTPGIESGPRRNRVHQLHYNEVPSEFYRRHTVLHCNTSFSEDKLVLKEVTIKSGKYVHKTT